jgi:hypothetical protein
MIADASGRRPALHWRIGALRAHGVHGDGGHPWPRQPPIGVTSAMVIRGILYRSDSL